MHARLLVKDMKERYMDEGWSRKKQILEVHSVQ
jgi:hypothetical protein